MHIANASAKFVQTSPLSTFAFASRVSGIGADGERPASGESGSDPSSGEC